EVPPVSETKVGVGVIGYGRIAKAHINALRKLPYIYAPRDFIPELVAVSGRTEAAVLEAARRYGVPGYYLDWARMLEDPRIDVVINCAWHDVHAKGSIRALEAGKHVLCEKPMATGRVEALAML